MTKKDFKWAVETASVKEKMGCYKAEFEGTGSLKRMGVTKDNFDAVLPKNYKLVYLGELSELQG